MSANIRALQAKKAEHLKAANALNGITDRALTADEQASLDRHIADVTALNAQIERAQFLESQSAGLGGVTIPANASISVTDRVAADPKRGFRGLGDFAASVARAGIGHGLDQRLAAAPGLSSNESTGSDGGFLIPPEISTEIWRAALTETSLLPLTANTELTRNSITFPKDETTPWGGSGVQAYWQSEAGAATATKPLMTAEAMVLHKLMVLVPVTNELIEDGAAIGSYLSDVAPERMGWKVDESILFGDGVGKPLGCLNANGGPLIVQAKESGQAANTIDPKNISKMVSRLLVGQLQNAIWLGNPDVLPMLEAMTLGNYPIFLPSQNAADGSYGMLKGRPVRLSEHAAAASAQSDLSLISLKGYRTITKAGGIETATSMHLYFDADATAFRFTFRLNGKPILSAPVTPPKSTNTRSHFVTLAAR